MLCQFSVESQSAFGRITVPDDDDDDWNNARDSARVAIDIEVS
jgi:hypothetical protein